MQNALLLITVKLGHLKHKANYLCHCLEYDVYCYNKELRPKDEVGEHIVLKHLYEAYSGEK
jgi:hypothetical protein